MSLSLSKRVSKLVGTDGDSSDIEGLPAPGEHDPGSDVMVVLNHVQMETDTSQIPPIQNCLADMMTPRAADKSMADETERCASRP